MSGMASQLKPREQVTANSVNLNDIVPKSFGAWAEEPDPVAQVNLSLVTPNDPTAGDRPTYDQTLMRTYRSSDGARVMLAMAYGRRQMQELKIHRPELCYHAQGFLVRGMGTRLVKFPDHRQLAAGSLMTQSRGRKEPVSYWIRIGNTISQSSWQTRWTIFRSGLAGYVPDGILVRASSLIEDDSQVEGALSLQRRFFSELYGSMQPQGQHLLTGN
jgi:EpsI family protein